MMELFRDVAKGAVHLQCIGNVVGGELARGDVQRRRRRGYLRTMYHALAAATSNWLLVSSKVPSTSRAGGEHDGTAF